MKQQEFILNGRKISSQHSFFKEITVVIFPSFEWKNGHTFDVLEDILKGGYGLIDYQESYIIRWLNFDSSKRKMNKILLDDILDILRSAENIELILET